MVLTGVIRYEGLNIYVQLLDPDLYSYYIVTNHIMIKQKNFLIRKHCVPHLRKRNVHAIN